MGLVPLRELAGENYDPTKKTMKSNPNTTQGKETKPKSIRVHRGAFIGKYFKSLALAADYYNKMDVWGRENQSIVEFSSGECLVVGNTSLEAMKL